ncbi:MAG TPA: glycosyltransferase family 39 protein [Nitrososphaeraceae archaeon]|nr:glycosyltransferase family 39 protein [Nitrososphaeraceae archaeon]
MGSINRYFTLKQSLTLLWIIIPLVLSAFTHLWNPVGYPAIHVDEGHYMRRAMQVIQGLGPQESNSTYDYGYDHPYFGQIFLAAALSIVNYPNSINPTVTPQSIEMLYLLPRVLMGLLAVVDTFLVYKIADTRYNRKVAFVSATLFAVMPLSGMLRGIFLDSISLPFILLSILFAVYYAKSSSRPLDSSNQLDGNVKKLRYLLLLLSGIFLGLAIFTKLPVFTFIPLIVYIIINKNILNSNNDKNTGNQSVRLNIKSLGIWFIPVLLIPLIWPGYALSVGQLGSWMDGVIYQTARDSGGKDLRSSFVLVFGLDPILLTIAGAATIWSVIKKDYFVLLWGLPYLVFLYFIGWVVPIHWINLVPIVCIASAVLIDNWINAAASQKFIRLYPHFIISAVFVFGFLGTTILVESNLNTMYFQVYYFMVQELQPHENTVAASLKTNFDEGTTIIGSHRTRALVWIPMYVFKDDVNFRETDIPKDNFTKPLQTKKFIIVADSDLIPRLTSSDQYERDRRVTLLYYNNSNTIATFIEEKLDKGELMNIHQNYGLGWFVDVRTNY